LIRSTLAPPGAPWRGADTPISHGARESVGAFRHVKRGSWPGEKPDRRRMGAGRMRAEKVFGDLGRVFAAPGGENNRAAHRRGFA